MQARIASSAPRGGHRCSTASAARSICSGIATAGTVRRARRSARRSLCYVAPDEREAGQRGSARWSADWLFTRDDDFLSGSDRPVPAVVRYDGDFVTVRAGRRARPEVTRPGAFVDDGALGGECLAPMMEGRHVEVGQLDLVACDPGGHIAEADLGRNPLAFVLRAEGEIHSHLRRIACLRARAAHEPEGDREDQQGLRHGSLSFVEAKVLTKATPGCHKATVGRGVSPRLLTSCFMRKLPQWQRSATRVKMELVLWARNRS